MKLVDISAKISKIALDPLNPRNPNQSHRKQEDIGNDTLKKREAKELLKSMKECIRWVNKIVIVSVSDHIAIHPELQKYDFSAYQYVVVEGNTRLSCLKSGAIQDLGDDSDIPVILAQKDPAESIDSFKEAILITQGIANVMVVKEWPPHAKAKHIYDMFLLKKSQDIDRGTAIKSISGELGISHDEARKAVKRYAIYHKIDAEAERINDEHWAYLEAFDINDETRSFIGLTNDLDWDEVKSDEMIPLIPELIRSATSQGIQSKQFRDIVREYIKQENANSRLYEDSVNQLKDVIDEDSETTLTSLISGGNQNSNEEEEWGKFLKESLKKLQLFPLGAEWASNCVPDFEQFKQQIGKIQRIIAVANGQP